MNLTPKLSYILRKTASRHKRTSALAQELLARHMSKELEGVFNKILNEPYSPKSVSNDLIPFTAYFHPDYEPEECSDEDNICCGHA